MLITVYLIECFLHFQPTPFQFNLHKRKTIYQNRDIITVFEITFLRNLITYLKLILTPIFLIDEIYPKCSSVITIKPESASKDRSFFKNISFGKMVENFLKFLFGKLGFIINFKLGFKVLN